MILIDDFRTSAEKAYKSGKDEDYLQVFRLLLAMKESIGEGTIINLLYDVPVSKVVDMTGDELKDAVERAAIALAKQTVINLIRVE